MTKETDRELLELAAKAAGWRDFDWLAGDVRMNVYDAQGKQSAWSPLTDDGDALRLAVKLGLVISPSRVTVMAYEPSSMARDEVYEPIRPDPLAATRRAIVRAAAEIGRAMP